MYFSVDSNEYYEGSCYLGNIIFTDKSTRQICKYMWLGDWTKIRECLVDNKCYPHPLLPSFELSPCTIVTPLSLACRYGDSDMVKELMDGSLHIIATPHLHRAVLECVRHGHQDCFREMMEILYKQEIPRDVEILHKIMASIRSHDFDDVVSLLDSEQRTKFVTKGAGGRVDLLNVLIVNGCPPSCVEALIQRGADIDDKDSHGLTPVVCAVLAGNADCLLFLLRSGVDICQQTFTPVGGDRCNALMCSACLTDSKMLQVLLEFIPTERVNDKTLTLQWTALSFASYFGHVDSVSELVTRGADSEILDGRNKNLLYVAMESGNHQCLKILQEKMPKPSLPCTINPGFWHQPLKPSVHCISDLVETVGVDVNALQDNGGFPLGMAAMRGWEDIVVWLLDHGAQVDAQDRWGHTALMAACLCGHESVLGILVNRGSDVNTRTESGIMALWFAAGNSGKEMVECLLDHGARINAVDGDGRTALMEACEKDYHSVVEVLVKRGADVNIRDRDRKNAIWYAVQSKSVESVRILLDGQVDINGEDNRKLISMAGRRVEIIECFLDHGAKIDAVNSLRRTVLMVACKKHYHSVVEVLVKRGADVNIRDRDGRNAIWYAVQSKSVESVRILFDAHADINGEDEQKLLIMAGGSIEIVQCLLDHVANIDAVDCWGKTALMEACKKNYHSVVEVLVKRGADVNFEDRRRRSAIIYAFGSESVESVRTLLDTNADVRGKNRKEQKVFTLAEGRAEVIECLLDHGANIDGVDCWGRTALMEACKKNYHSVVEVLVRRGADVNIRDRDRRNAIWYAVQSKSVESVRILFDVQVDINGEDECCGRKFLTMAGDKVEIIECFLDHGVNIDAVDSDGRTVLIEACKKNYHHSVVEVLVKRGADVDFKDNDEWNAIWYAVQSKSAESVRILLDAHADISGEDKYGQNLLTMAVNSGKEIVECLLDRGKNIDAVDCDGRTALMEACEKDYHSVVEVLVKRGADVNIRDRDRRNAIWYAVQSKSVESVRILFDAQIDINCEDECCGRKFLTMAGDKVEIIECFLDHGVNIDAVDSDGRTVLMEACKKNYHHSVVEVLVKRGADVNIKDCVGQSALWYALHSRWWSTAKFVEILLDASVDINIKGCESIAEYSGIFSESCMDKLITNGSIVANGRVKQVHTNAIRNKMGYNFILWIKQLLRHQVFDWDVVPLKLISGHGFQVTSMGVCPGTLRLGDKSVSPLLAAFLAYDVPLVRYFVANLYFYPEDYNTLTTNNKIRNLIQYDIISRNQDLCSLYHRLTCRQPLSLQTWSFLTVSKAISLSGLPCHRPLRVSSLPIPSKMKSALSFQTELSRTCPAKMKELENTLLPPFESWCDRKPSPCSERCRSCHWLKTRSLT